MTLALFISRHRRQLLFCSATVVLHYLLLVWVGREMGRPVQRTARAEPVSFVALLPGPVPVAAEPVRPAAPPPPRRALKPPVRPSAYIPDQPTPDAPMPALALDGAQAGAEEPQAHVESTLDSAAAGTLAQPVQQEQAPAEPAEPAAPPPRRYKTSLPPSADMTLAVSRTDADGTHWTGEAVIGWKISGEHYRMTVEAGIRLLLARVNLLVLTSEGAVGESGFAPATLTEKRRGRSSTTTHFDQHTQRITFSGSPYTFPLLPGSQDKATVPLQLAAIARADPGQLSGDIELMVGEDKDASLFRFTLLGQEEIETSLGKLQTWHLSRPPRPGVYSSRLDIWLAPAHGWYPVQFRNTEANGAVTTQTVNKIVVTDSGK